MPESKTKRTNESYRDFELASNFTCADYEKARDAKVPDRDDIANAVQRRFTERYIEPVLQSKKKHGFAIMAVSCLMIEALESFRQGWETSERKSERAFRLFFDNAPAFSAFSRHAHEFYTNVRCGILHQAETTGGWTILQTGPLFDPSGHTINATFFVRTLERFLNNFCAELRQKEWDSTDWKRVVTKMNALVEHCKK